MSLFSIDTFGQLEPYLTNEWLLTNGLGGFAMATVPGANSRRYHGLLIAATTPPVGRVSVLSRLGEMLILDNDPSRPHELAVNQFKDNVHPHGEQYLRRFELEHTATWHYEVDAVKVTKTLQVPWLKNVVGVRYRVEASEHRDVELRVFPFFALRDFHALRRAAGYDMATKVSDDKRSIAVTADDLTAHVVAEGDGQPEFVSGPNWWYGHFYQIENDRGQDDTEDLFNPGRFTLKFRGSATLTIWASLQPGSPPIWEDELIRRKEAVEAACKVGGAAPPASAPASAPKPSPQGAPSLAPAAPNRRTASFDLTSRAPDAASEGGEFDPCNPSPGTMQKLLRAANDFVVYRKTPDGHDGATVIAGYPWFADWGRDTMIALPGLFLVPRRFQQAKEVLSVFAAYVSEGMIPNRFNDYTNEPEYNTVDASLWFVHACFEYAKASGDNATLEKVLKPACRQILDGYRRGTRYGIGMDEADGLIAQGNEQTQLTWMDAKCGGVAFTPRQGKPVEINALWYHALVLMGENDLAAKARENFSKAFWLSPFRGLADVVSRNGDGSYQRDTAIRPNQIFAASLPNSPLTAEQQSAVVEVVRRELLTPYGLRTLNKGDVKYKNRYRGPQFVRDEAYHNGMVWPWLIGGFLDAYLRVHNNDADAQAQVRRWLSPLIEHLNNEACIGSISEIFEAEEPYRPVGCCAQAWSVAEVLRLAVKIGV
jgi:glycogen debranching enzyme